MSNAMKALAAAFGIMWIAACGVWAESSRSPGEEMAALSFATTGEVSFEDPNNPNVHGHVSLQEATASAPFAYKSVGEVSLTAGGAAAWTRLDFTDHPDIRTEDLYGVALVVVANRPARSRMGWTILFIPGYYTDFREGRTGEGKFLLHAGTTWPIHPRMQLKLGAAYDTAFGKPRLYPGGGVTWQSHDNLKWDLVLPSPSVYWTPQKDWGVFAVVQPAGDQWIVNDDETGENVFRIGSWRAGLGLERRVRGSLWVRLVAGWDFARRYEVRRGRQVVLDDDVDDTVYASAALVLY